jgi:hypothetical protein
MKEKKKINIVLKVGIIIIGIIVLYFIVAYIYLSVTDISRSGIEISCPICDTNLANTKDCYTFLENISGDPNFASFRDSSGIPTNNDIDKIVKNIYPDDNSVYCTYYAKPEF